MTRIVYVFFIAITLLAYPYIAQANKLKSSLSSSFTISATPELTSFPQESHLYNRGFFASKIQICIQYEGKKSCDSYPQISSHLFKGTVSDWGYFINRCTNFDHVNTFTDVVFALEILAVMPAMGFVKTVGAEIAVSYIGESVYPSGIDQRALSKASQMIYYLLKDDKSQKVLHSRYLLALKEILNTCSTLFSEEYINREQSKCISNCHGSKAKLKKRNWTNQHLTNAKDIDLNEEILNYLEENSIAQ